MPAKSEKQRRFMALVRAYKRGEVSDVSESVKRAAESISDKDATDFMKKSALEEAGSLRNRLVVHSALLRKEAGPRLQRLGEGLTTHGKAFKPYVEWGLPIGLGSAWLGGEEYMRHRGNKKQRELFEKIKEHYLSDPELGWTVEDFTSENMRMKPGIRKMFEGKGYKGEKGFSPFSSILRAGTAAMTSSPWYWRKMYGRRTQDVIDDWKKNDPVKYKQYLEHVGMGGAAELPVLKGIGTSIALGGISKVPGIVSNVEKASKGLATLEARGEELGEIMEGWQGNLDKKQLKKNIGEFFSTAAEGSIEGAKTSAKNLMEWIKKNPGKTVGGVAGVAGIYALWKILKDREEKEDLEEKAEIESKALARALRQGKRR